MARVLYSIVFYLAQPLIWLRLLWRSRRQPEYLQHVGSGLWAVPPGVGEGEFVGQALFD